MSYIGLPNYASANSIEEGVIFSCIELSFRDEVTRACVSYKSARVDLIARMVNQEKNHRLDFQ